jgi:TonB family protein
MSKAEQLPDVAEARPHGNRAHMRRKLSPMAYVELGQDNGGILLNLSEGGFAVQSALALTSRVFSELRFQVPALQGWLTASGRIVWISDSKKEAGIQFTELPGEARREIHKWVSAEGESQRVKERIPVARPSAPATQRTEGGEERRQILDVPYRGGGGAHQPSLTPNSPVNAARPESEPERTSEQQTVGVAVAEPPTQEFHFTDYSMFAAEPEREGIWLQQPAGNRGNWRRAAVGVLVAGLFFALGATVGKDSVDRWIAYLGGWTPSQIATAPTPKVMPPAPPDQNIGAAEGKTEDRQAVRGADEESQEGAAGDGIITSEAGAGSASGSRSGNESKGDIEAERPPIKSESSKGGPVGGVGAAVPGANDPRSRHAGEDVLGRSGRGMDGAQGRMGTEHSILVNAPEPGSRPFFVNLPGEAVSASGAIAISARRTLEIPPRSSMAASGSQRVVIGKLIAHSEPFYPAEARRRGVQGSVELRARVGRTGEVIGVTPVSGPWLLFPAAVNAVREWRYEPTYVNGDPAETLADVTIVFRLQ